MLAQAIENTNLVLRGNGKDVYDIHARVEDGGWCHEITTAWEPTPAELARLNEGKPVYVTQLVLKGDGFQPTRVEVKP